MEKNDLKASLAVSITQKSATRSRAVCFLRKKVKSWKCSRESCLCRSSNDFFQSIRFSLLAVAFDARNGIN